MGAKENLELLCDNGHQYFADWSNFKQGNRCPECRRVKIGNDHRLDFYFIKNEFSKRYYELLEDKYVHSHAKMKFRCNIHPELIQEVTYSGLVFQNINSCKLCEKEHRKQYYGENHHNWQGGVTRLKEYLHNKIITEWKLASMKSSNYKCVITGDKFKDIHHLYSFNKILQETLNELNILLFDQIINYTKEELDAIGEKCLEIHYRYPLGVCLRRDVHKLYHTIHGNNNTPEQFEEFRCRFLDGEFNEKLNILTKEDDIDESSFFVD